MRIVYIGTGEIGLPVLEDLLASREHQVIGVVTQPDRPAGRHRTLKASPIKKLAKRKFIPIFQPERIRRDTTIDQIAFLKPDVIVICAYGQILPDEILELPTVACLNLHASLLPRHRGAAPVQAAIEAGDRLTGITVMYVDSGLDTGDILLKREIPIRRRETAGSLHDRLALVAPEALREALRLLKEGSAPRIPQDDKKATYAPKLTSAHGELDWSRDQDELDRKIRALNPWPGAFTFLRDESGKRQKLKIYSTIQSRRSSGDPGQILKADRHGLLVACGKGGLLLRDIQREGKRRMSAGEFLLGHEVRPGAVLG